jgi:hypothetical protein
MINSSTTSVQPYSIITGAAFFELKMPCIEKFETLQNTLPDQMIKPCPFLKTPPHEALHTLPSPAPELSIYFTPPGIVLIYFLTTKKILDHLGLYKLHYTI